MAHSALRSPHANLISGAWKVPSGTPLVSRDPADPSRVVWEGHESPGDVDAAVAAARAAAPTWAATPFEVRARVLRRFAQIASARVDELTAVIRDEVGKPAWDARAEAQLLAAKVDVTLDAGPTGPLRRVTDYELQLGPGKAGKCWFRPHGVMAVLGPFNFPAHLPNGHIVPALAMGNTVVFKPSDKAPACGQMLAELLHEALLAEGLPPGVVNVVQGGAGVAAALASHPDIDGVLFTGSWPVGRRIMQANLDRPGRILALEMGGNSPAVILPDADLRQAVIECVRCAFIGAGQRCTCTRRLLVHREVAERVISAVCKAAAGLTIGDTRAESPVFMGPVINAAARSEMLATQASLAVAGGKMLLEMKAMDGPGSFVSPGVMRVDRFERGASGAGADVEVFGPFLRIAVVDSLEDAIRQANATEFGLAAAVFTNDAANWERFATGVRAGCINWNTGTAGASGKLPFGGLGVSGNHRPAGAFSLDYCACPVAGMVESGAAAATPPGLVVDEAWVR